MTQALQKLYTFDEFVEFLKVKNENICYELYDGDIIQMPLPTGEHEEIVGFLIKILSSECLRLNLNYFLPSKTLVKPKTKQSGYFPDVLFRTYAKITKGLDLSNRQGAKNAKIS